MKTIEGLAGGLGMSPFLAAYLIGVLGSFAVELAWLLRQLFRDHNLPTQYKMIAYPVVRVLFAFLAAGPLTVMLTEGSNSAWTAFYIGITAPLFFDRAAAGIMGEPVYTDVGPPGLKRPPTNGDQGTEGQQAA